MARVRILLLALTATLLLPGVLYAQQSQQVLSGTTTLVLNSSLTGALATAGIQLRQDTPAELSATSNTTLLFPIVGGGVDLDTALGAVYHSGGLTLSNSHGTVTFSAFAVTNPGGSVSPGVSALVTANNKVTGVSGVFALSTAHATFAGGTNFVLSNATLTLTSQAAGLLNQTLGTGLFQSGQVVGSVTISGHAYAYAAP